MSHTPWFIYQEGFSGSFRHYSADPLIAQWVFPGATVIGQPTITFAENVLVTMYVVTASPTEQGSPTLSGGGVDWEIARTFEYGNVPLFAERNIPPDPYGVIDIDPLYRYGYVFEGISEDVSADIVTATFPEPVHGAAMTSVQQANGALSLVVLPDASVVWTRVEEDTGPVVVRNRVSLLTAEEHERRLTPRTNPLVRVVLSRTAYQTYPSSGFTHLGVSELPDFLFIPDPGGSAILYYSPLNDHDADYSVGIGSFDVAARPPSVDPARVFWGALATYGYVLHPERTANLRQKQRDDTAPRAGRRNAPTSAQEGRRASRRNVYT